MEHECFQDDRIARIENDFREHDKTSVPIRDCVNRTSNEIIHHGADISFLKEQVKAHKKEWQDEAKKLEYDFLNVAKEIRLILLGDGLKNKGLVKIVEDNSTWIEDQKSSGNSKMNAVFNMFLCICGGVITAIIINMIHGK